MRPLCEKEYLYKIIELVATILVGPFAVLFLINSNEHIFLLIISIVLLILILICLIDVVYWIFQPKVLIYQDDNGIVINRNLKIEYTEIKEIYYKNYWFKERRGQYYKSPYIGTIYIKLKSNKIYKIKNSSNPRMVVDELLKIKKQKKYR